MLYILCLWVVLVNLCSTSYAINLEPIQGVQGVPHPSDEYPLAQTLFSSDSPASAVKDLKEKRSYSSATATWATSKASKTTTTATTSKKPTTTTSNKPPTTVSTKSSTSYTKSSTTSSTKPSTAPTTTTTTKKTTTATTTTTTATTTTSKAASQSPRCNADQVAYCASTDGACQCYIRIDGVTPLCSRGGGCADTGVANCQTDADCVAQFGTGNYCTYDINTRCRNGGYSCQSVQFCDQNIPKKRIKREIERVFEMARTKKMERRAAAAEKDV